MSTALLDIASLEINGTDARKTHAALMDAVTSITMVETITGASTVEVAVQDVDRTLLRSPILKSRSTLVLDGAGFELAAVRKTGSSLALTFEDIAIARLRTHTSFRKSPAGQTSRTGFVQLLAREEPWIDVVTTTGPKSLVELSRGKAAGPKGGKAEAESSWDAAVRIMGEIGWRVFARRGDLWVVPDSYLKAQTPYRLTENTGGVDEIDVDYDVGKPAATAKLTVRAGKTALLAGSAVQLADMGIADGVWIVEKITRTPDSLTASVDLLRPQPTLPEPKDDTAAADEGEFGEGGYKGSYLGSSQKNIGAPTSGDTERFVQLALAQRGKPYVWGASGPGSFDCSGLVQYCAHRLGYNRVHKPAKALYAFCASEGQAISVSQAIATRGALLFRLHKGATNHVAISLGNGQTIEAMGKAYGVKIGSTKGRFTDAGLLPGISVRSRSTRNAL